MVSPCTRIAAVAVGLLVTSLASTAPDAEAPSPARPLFTEAGLAAIHDFMQAAVRDGRTPAATALLARDDEILWLETAIKGHSSNPANLLAKATIRPQPIHHELGILIPTQSHRRSYCLASHRIR
jgi:hypothetical protein